MKVFVASAAVLLATAVAQQVGTLQTETHPSLTSQTCTAAGCTTEQTKIVIDANWRWLHKVGTSSNCYSGNKWDATVCPDNAQCTTNCALEGSDYTNTYGITTSGNSVKLSFVTKHQYGTNVGSRVYLMDTDTTYKNFKLLNREFAFDTDVSKLPCGLNGALYFTQMDMDGGMARFPTNKAGAKYGTGYCDAQCARDLKFISGQANVEGWVPSTNDVNAGKGSSGSCCPEMDIWEANSMANAFTSHPCSVDGQTRCTGDVQCGSGTNRYKGFCDMDGCDFNPYRLGDQSFFGAGSNFKVDSTKPMTVVTRFVTSDNTDNGDLVKIERFYIQNGVTIANAVQAVAGVDAVNSLNDKVCSQAKVAFGDTDDHKAKGGLTKMGAAMKKGMVLVMSLWDDHDANCLWLDSAYPLNKSTSVPGVLRGACPTTSGVPADVEAQSPGATVTFSNIKVGTIGSIVPITPTTAPTTVPPTTTPKPTTTKPTTKPTTVPPTTTPKPTTPGAIAQKWEQCGGIGWSGATACVSGTTCNKVNDYYSQCY